jgi:hypothetical protein
MSTPASQIMVANPTSPRVLPVDRRRALILTPNRTPAVVVANAGTPGPSGIGADAHFVFTQGSPSTKWVVLHKLKKFPSVLVQDSANDEVEGDIEYVNNEELVITFSSAFSGIAYLN